MTPKDKFNLLLPVPMEQWRHDGVKLSACSASGNGLVNSFFARYAGVDYYGFRKHELVNGKFTGKEWFEVEVDNK